MQNGFIKLDRAVLDWEWYKDATTSRVWFHLLLIANYEEKQFQGTIIKRGQAVISYSKIASDLDISIQQARTAISHLKSTGEITVISYPKFSVVTIKKYNEYQLSNRQHNRRATGKQQAKQQASNNNGINKEYSTTYYRRKKEDAAAFDVLSDDRDPPPEGFNSWEEYYEFLRE